MNLKNWTWVFAIVFLLIGILGFVPGITTNEGLLLGIFAVDGTHNLVHLLTGLIALIVAFKGDRAMRLFFQIFGWVYLVVTVVGFVQSTSVLGLFGVNLADNILHLVVAVVALWLGYSGRKSMSGMESGGTPAQTI